MAAIPPTKYPHQPDEQAHLHGLPRISFSFTNGVSAAAPMRRHRDQGEHDEQRRAVLPLETDMATVTNGDIMVKRSNTKNANCRRQLSCPRLWRLTDFSG